MRGASRAGVLLVLLVGCGDGVPKPAAMDPVSIAEAEELARRFEAAMEPCDPAKLQALVDGETLWRSVVAAADVPAPAKQDFLRGVPTNTMVGATLCEGLFNEVWAHELVRVRVVDGAPRPVLRLLAGDSFNYLELRLGKSRTDHRVRALDVTLFSVGEPYSATLATLLEESVASADRVGAVAGWSETTKQMREADARDDHAEIRRLVATMPRKLRESRAMRRRDLSAALELEEPSYVELLAQYERSFPGDPSLALATLNRFYHRKDVGGALAAIERIDQLVGGDPYLGSMRALALIMDPTAAHLAEAERWATVTTDAMPGLESGWWTLAQVRVRRTDHAGVVAALQRLDGGGVDLDVEAMRADPDYQAFVASDEFGDWWAASHRSP